jgi:5-deoxy-D-glucuronate isomerase
MHVHANPINPNAQLDALYSAQKAAAKREAARTRKKLSEFASELSGEAESGEACIVKLEGREESQEETKEHNQEGTRKNQKERPGSEDMENSISDWA